MIYNNPLASNISSLKDKWIKEVNALFIIIYERSKYNNKLIKTHIDNMTQNL